MRNEDVCPTTGKPVTHSRGITIRAPRPVDLTGIDELNRRAFGLGRSPSFHRWWYQRPGTDPAITRICLDEDERVVGISGASERRMSIFGTEVPAIFSGCLYIDEEHRSHGVFVRMARGVTSDETLLKSVFLFGVTNLAGTQAARLSGCRPVGDLGYMLLPLDVTPYVSRHLKPRFLARAVAGGINLGFQLARRRPPRAPFSVATITRFDERFDRLWEREKADWGIATSRTAAYLDWRYTDALVDYRVIAAESADGDEVLGFMVLTVSEGRDRRMGSVVDCCCGRQAVDVFDCLFGEAVRWFTGKGCHVIRAWALAGGWMHEQTRRHRFLRRPSGHFLVVRPTGPDAPDGLFDPDNWHLTQGDTDHIDCDA